MLLLTDHFSMCVSVKKKLAIETSLVQLFVGPEIKLNWIRKELLLLFVH